MDVRSGIKSTVLLLCSLYAMTAVAGGSITGTVRNQTTNRPSAGDEVVLFRLGNGMEEEARTRTDEQGAFSLPANATDGGHLIRVLHQGVNYDQTVSGSAPLQIAVYDAVASIPGLSGNLGMAQVESDGAMLKITEMYSISNRSNPPVTQYGPHNFDISLPPRAVLDSMVAKRSAGVWLKITPAPVAGVHGRYGVDFPLRPGDTLFKFIYRLPQERSTLLHIRLAYPIQNFAVLHPDSMSFKASHPQEFSTSGMVRGLQLEQVVSKPVIGEVPAFEISGVGTAPAQLAGEKASAPPPAVASDVGSNTPSPNSGQVASATSTKEIWALGSGFVCLLAVAAVLLWRRKVAVGNGARTRSDTRAPILEALKDELLHLETERLDGTITAQEYDSSRHALDMSIQRVLDRGRSSGATF